MCVDENGNLYVAQYEMGQVAVIEPSGRIVGYIMVPEDGGTQTTNVAFGGPDRNILYITESGKNIIYRVKMNVRGLKLLRDME
jgi:gluconolactonase